MCLCVCVFLSGGGGLSPVRVWVCVWVRRLSVGRQHPGYDLIIHVSHKCCLDIKTSERLSGKRGRERWSK